MSGRQVIERVWDAPIALVWELWTSPKGVESWFGPRGFQVEVSELDLRVGGTFTYTMKAASPEMAAMMEKSGKPTNFQVVSTITVCEPPNKFAYDSPYGPETMTTEVEFTQTEAGVKMVLVIDATKPEMTTGAARGWVSTLERFAEQLA